MAGIQHSVVESAAMAEFARIMQPPAVGDPPLRATGVEPPSVGTPAPRLHLREESLKNGLGQLVLTLVKLLHELLERQAIPRVAAGSLTETEIERLGATLMRQAEEIDRLREAFNLEEDDLNLDLGPLGRLF